MARWLGTRFYVKKRRGRRTGSPALGGLGLGLFFAALFAVGVGLFVMLLVEIALPEWAANHQFLEARAVVLKKRIGESTSADAAYRPEILIRYQVEDEAYETWSYDVTRNYASNRDEQQKILDRFVIGQQYPCWYNPHDPSQAVLVRGYSWGSWLMLLLPLSFVVVGGGGLAYTLLNAGKSAERRAAPGRISSSLDFLDTLRDTASDYPFVPRDTNLTNSPGTTLAFRLPLETAPTWALVVGLAVALVACAVSIYFLFVGIHGHFTGDHDWVLTLFSGVGTPVAIFLAVYMARQVLVATGVGPTLVEISDHPLLPGREYEVYLSQAGRLRMNLLELLLVCDEKATFQQGTNTRTEVRRVHQEQLHRHEEFEILPGAPLAARLKFQIPALAMHSFKAPHNEVFWRMIVRGNVQGWPDFERHFPLVVHPPHGREGDA
ncbi:MAG: DUF3592 domain-containing protein [Pirellulales bacterium]|nr:DUF3592 domain-containing protein [Pirellulales bacterium]